MMENVFGQPVKTVIFKRFCSMTQINQHYGMRVLPALVSQTCCKVCPEWAVGLTPCAAVVPEFPAQGWQCDTNKWQVHPSLVLHSFQAGQEDGPGRDRGGAGVGPAAPGHQRISSSTRGSWPLCQVGKPDTEALASVLVKRRGDPSPALRPFLQEASGSCLTAAGCSSSHLATTVPNMARSSGLGCLFSHGMCPGRGPMTL